MNFELFITKRILFNNAHKDTISSPIVKISIAAIALGVLMMLIAVGTGRGLREKIQEKIASLNGHIQIMNYDTNRSEVSVVPISKEQPFYPNWEAYFREELDKIPTSFLEKSLEITHIQPIITKGGIIRTEKTFEGIIAKGVDANFRWEAMKSYLVVGKLPDFTSEEVSDEVLISSYLANRLSLKVGDTCQTLFVKEDGSKIPNQRLFKVAGIYNSGFQQFDASFILVDMRHLQRMNKWNEAQVGMFEVFVNNFDKMNEMNKAIYSQIDYNLDAQTIAQKYQTIFDWFHTFNLNILIIISIMILVGGVNMITALLVLILERTPMIGILKALGAKNWSIQQVFLYNAGYLIGLGLLFGNVIGLGLLFIQKYFSVLKLNPSVYYVSEVAVAINFWEILALNVGVFILCLLMLLLPSYIVTKISPVKAIKFD